MTMLYSEWYEMCLRPTSCFIRHFPSSVSSAVGWVGYADCTESIIISSSTRANFKQNHGTLNRIKTKSTSTDPYFLMWSLPSISSLFAAGSCAFLEIQLTAMGEGKVLKAHKNSGSCVLHLGNCVYFPFSLARQQVKSLRSEQKSL